MAARIVVTEFVSLDGVMEAPGGEDFKYQNWSFEYDRGDDGNQFKLEETRSADALLIGRRTYESFAGAWPKREGEFARPPASGAPTRAAGGDASDYAWHSWRYLAARSRCLHPGQQHGRR